MELIAEGILLAEFPSSSAAHYGSQFRGLTRGSLSGSDGDLIRIPFEDVSVTVDGAVKRPGHYELVHPLMSRMKCVAAREYTLTDPFVPAGIIAALATFCPAV
jgi:hypothetical protein